MTELGILLRKGLRSLWNLRFAAREHSLLKVGFIGGFLVSVIVGLWVLFLEGFRFLDAMGGMGLMVIQKLFALFFFGLAVMLVISSGIASYTTYYRSEEVPFLLLRPIRMGTLVVYKFLETSFWSAWAFFLIIVPFVGAYAMHEKLSMLFSLWTLLFSVPFVLLCSGLGCLLGMVLVRWYPGGRTGILLAVLFLVGLGLLGARAGASVTSAGTDTGLVLTRLLPGMELASHPLWPSWWVGEGIMAFTRGQSRRGWMLLLVLTMNMLAVVWLVEAVGTRIFYDGWQRVVASGRRRRAKERILGFLERPLARLAPDMRALLIKDLRVFLRDPGQWSQGVIFFGLLGIYFLNLRTLNYHTLSATWRNLIAFLNVFAVSAVMCSFGTRFVYPQPSLEGQGFWIIGLSPTTIGRVLMAKFYLAATGLSLAGVGLMWLSVAMLGMPLDMQLVAIGIALLLPVAVAGLSTGLGALFIDLRQRNPAAIISGFGGTLNLMLSLLYMLLTILPFGVLYHFRFTARMSDPSFHLALALIVLWLILFSLLLGGVPMLLGRRALMKREY